MVHNLLDGNDSTVCQLLSSNRNVGSSSVLPAVSGKKKKTKSFSKASQQMYMIRYLQLAESIPGVISACLR